ncbi:polysaccharide deacetylase family protein [Streptacidiphilus monticola]
MTARHQAPAAEQLTSDDLRALLNAGVSLGNHSLGHAPLASCDSYALHEQVVGGHDRMVALTGVAPTAFAYPDHTPDLRASALLRELGYRLAFTTDGRDVDPPWPRTTSR